MLAIYLNDILFIVFPYDRLHTHDIKTATKQLATFVNPLLISGEQRYSQRDSENHIQLNEASIPVSDSYFLKYRRTRVSFPVVGNGGSPVDRILENELVIQCLNFWNETLATFFWKLKTVSSLLLVPKSAGRTQTNKGGQRGRAP